MGAFLMTARAIATLQPSIEERVGDVTIQPPNRDLRDRGNAGDRVLWFGWRLWPAEARSPSSRRGVSLESEPRMAQQTGTIRRAPGIVPITKASANDQCTRIQALARGWHEQRGAVSATDCVGTTGDIYQAYCLVPVPPVTQPQGTRGARFRFLAPEHILHVTVSEELGVWKTLRNRVPTTRRRAKRPNRCARSAISSIGGIRLRPAKPRSTEAKSQGMGNNLANSHGTTVKGRAI